MWLLGFFAYQTSAALLQDFSERQLDALAESKARDVGRVLEGWRDRVRLIASRTQLRLDVDAYNTAPDDRLRGSIERIVNDAQRATRSVVAIGLDGAGGERLVTSGRAELVAQNLATLAPAKADADVTYVGYNHEGSDWFVEFATPLRLEQKTIGRLTVAFRSDDLEAVTLDYTGLGELGETLILRLDADSRLALLHPLRHAGGPPPNLSASAFLAAAANGTQGVFTEDQLDYRGEPAWAATRFIPDVNWGLAVQVNIEEELYRVYALREALIELGLSLSAFAIIGGTLLGIYLARPLQHFADIVDRVRQGETDLRAEVVSEDEIGRLGQALNEFLDGMQSTRDRQ